MYRRNAALKSLNIVFTYDCINVTDINLQRLDVRLTNIKEELNTTQQIYISLRLLNEIIFVLIF